MADRAIRHGCQAWAQRRMSADANRRESTGLTRKQASDGLGALVRAKDAASNALMGGL